MSHSLLKIVFSGVISGALAIDAAPALADNPSCELTSSAERALGRMLAVPSDFSFEATVLLEKAEGRQFLALTWPDASGGGSLRRMNSTANPIIELWPAPADSPERVCDVLRVYTPNLVKGRVVAGRETDRLTLRPRDTLRLPHQINVDRDTGMSLAMATVGPDGQMLQRYEFAEIRYGGRPEMEVKRRTDAGYARGREVVPGFYLVGEEPDGGVFVVSDGLATASVFVEPLPLGAPGGEGAIIEGAMLTYTRGVPGVGGGLLISVLGEVPLVTARLLADAVRPSQGAD